MKRPAPSECPICGTPLEPYYRACPDCGACHETGWREDAEEIDTVSALGLDFEDNFEEDMPERQKRRRKRAPTGIPAWAWIVAILILLAYASRIFF